MIYINRIKGKTISAGDSSEELNEILQYCRSRTLAFGQELNDKIEEILTGLVEDNQSDGQPRNILKSRDGEGNEEGLSVGDVVHGAIGVGTSLAMKAQNEITLTLPNSALNAIDNIPGAGITPYYITLPARFGLLAGNIAIFIPEFMGALTVAGTIGSIPGINTPIPGTGLLKTGWDNAKDAINTLSDWGLNAINWVADAPAGLLKYMNSREANFKRSSSQLLKRDASTVEEYILGAQYILQKLEDGTWKLSREGVEDLLNVAAKVWRAAQEIGAAPRSHGFTEISEGIYAIALHPDDSIAF